MHMKDLLLTDHNKLDNNVRREEREKLTMNMPDNLIYLDMKSDLLLFVALQ